MHVFQFFWRELKRLLVWIVLACSLKLSNEITHHVVSTLIDLEIIVDIQFFEKPEHTMGARLVEPGGR